MHPIMVMHPIRPDLIGKDLTEFRDPDGKQQYIAFVQTVRTAGSGLVDCLFPRPGDPQPVPKLSYVQGFAPWGWVIGSGVYVDDVIAQERRLARTLLGLGAGIGLLLGWSYGGWAAASRARCRNLPPRQKVCRAAT